MPRTHVCSLNITVSCLFSQIISTRSSITDADVIFVLKNGAVHEQGSHTELMTSPNGEYRKSYLMQSTTTLKSKPVDSNNNNGKEKGITK